MHRGGGLLEPLEEVAHRRVLLGVDIRVGIARAVLVRNGRGGWLRRCPLLRVLLLLVLLLLMVEGQHNATRRRRWTSEDDEVAVGELVRRAWCQTMARAKPGAIARASVLKLI